MMVNVKNEKPSPGLEEFCHEFLRDRLSEYQTITRRCEVNDFEQVRKMAHKWKGFSAPYGFNHLEELSTSLEKAASLAEPTKVKALLGEIDLYLKAKMEFMNHNAS